MPVHAANNMPVHIYNRIRAYMDTIVGLRDLVHYLPMLFLRAELSGSAYLVATWAIQTRFNDIVRN